MPRHAQQVPIDDSARVDHLYREGLHELTVDACYCRCLISNAVFVGHHQPEGADSAEMDRRWICVDTGTPGSTGRLRMGAAWRFGRNSRPYSIVLTHGHFDHVGGIHSLADRWNCPIFAHPLEMPYLSGQKKYPPPDPTVGGGMMAALSPLYPRGPVDVSDWLVPLPDDGSIPGMPGWRWIHTPGHSPGHVSLWKERDRLLVVGDAFVTTRQESAYNALAQKPEMHGPPMYFTPDWHAARESVRLLADLEPEIVVTGHGAAMRGPEMRRALHELADRFDEVAVPRSGRYVHREHRGEHHAPSVRR